MRSDMQSDLSVTGARTDVAGQIGLPIYAPQKPPAVAKVEPIVVASAQRLRCWRTGAGDGGKDPKRPSQTFQVPQTAKSQPDYTHLRL